MNTLVVAVALMLLTCPISFGELSPRGRLRQLRFSPDGQYVLAQTDSLVAVLMVEPFSLLFTAPAEIASRAEFSPDSREVVFLNSTAHGQAPACVACGAMEPGESHPGRFNRGSG